MSDKIFLRGDHYSVGKQLGTAKKQSIHYVLNVLQSRDFYKSVLEYLNTKDGKYTYELFLQTTRKYCPNYIDELRGVAEGADVTFQDLFVYNLDSELAAILRLTPGSSHDVVYGQVYDGCTNISIETDGETFLVHSEDVPPTIKDMGIILSAEITDQGGNIIEKWTDYVIPGYIAGNKFGFNSNGKMHASNAIDQEGVNKHGIPRKFMMRSLVPLTSTKDIKDKLLSYPGIATGYNLQIVNRDVLANGDVKTTHTIFEIAGTDRGTILAELKPTKFYHHCNIFQHLSHSCHPEESSIHRAAVIGQLSNTHDVITRDDLLNIMSNQRDQKFPVYRTGKFPDYLATAAIGCFDVMRGTLDVYTDKPNITKPVYTLHIVK